MAMEAIGWEDLSPGRCEHLQVPSLPTGFVSVSVLDAPDHLMSTRPFAALLVPSGQEEDWMFCTANGLWELVYSASVLRLVVLRRPIHLLPAREEGSIKKLSMRSADVNLHDPSKHNATSSFSRGASRANPFYVDLTAAHGNDDDFLKTRFAPLLSVLFPWSHCHLGPTPDPYVVYEDNVLERLVVNIRYSEELGTHILVEDVELTCISSDEMADQGPQNCRLRRRMRFEQMPNLIQTEVLVSVYRDGQQDPRFGIQNIKLWQQRDIIEDESGTMSSMQNCEVSLTALDVQPDHSELVQVYLRPIVAGLVLASACLQSCLESQMRPRVLTIGLGGGALPIFLHKQFGFSVLAIDIDKTVVELARSYFGFVENEHLQAQVNDGIEVVYNLAHHACRNGLVSTEILKEWQEVNEGCDLEKSAIASCDDLRMHVIVVDVCVSDACSGLLSPPMSFLTNKFLLAVLLSLHEGGMLIMNVMPRSPHDLMMVGKYIRKVFSGIYEIPIDDNHVLFALRSKVADVNMNCRVARLVAGAVGEGYFNRLDELKLL